VVVRDRAAPDLLLAEFPICEYSACRVERSVITQNLLSPKWRSYAKAVQSKISTESFLLWPHYAVVLGHCKSRLGWLIIFRFVPEIQSKVRF
jgi:hypothetical protein